MTTIPVVWLNLHQDTCRSPGMWDQAMLQELLAGDLHLPPNSFKFEQTDDVTDGCVLVIPGRFHVEDVDEINEAMNALYSWVLVIVTSDEERLFPVEQLRHPNMVVWLMTPRPGDRVKTGYTVGLGEGWQPGHRQRVRETGFLKRPNEWIFEGQVTHERRRVLSQVLRSRNDGLLIERDGFAQGEQKVYVEDLAQSKIALCPSGPATPDSFRFYEALEAGCVPIADACCQDYDRPGYWDCVLPGPRPFREEWHWGDVGPHIDDELRAWPMNAVRAGEWWRQKKRDLAWTLHDTVRKLSGLKPSTHPLADNLITVIMVTSPTPTCSTEYAEATIASIRESLPFCEIILACDGVRPEQEDRRAAYEEYLRRIVWMTHHHWENVVSVIMKEHGHQALTAKLAMDHVRTPYILFMEHDTPLQDMSPGQMRQCLQVLLDGELDVMRFCHESTILPDYEHMMLGGVTGSSTLYMRTYQWSQRPHLASSAYYRMILELYFGKESRTMIEDVMHGVVKNTYLREGMTGWFRHRLGIYHPTGSIQRSTHLDGRGADPKFDMVYEYDGPTPLGAPAPMSQRMEDPRSG